jgi:hypothetical protein
MRCIKGLPLHLISLLNVWFYLTLLVLSSHAMKRARPSHRGLLRHKNEQLVPTASGPLRLWIRADNLSPLQVAEGEARLTNDLTVLSLEERKSKRVANWSLHLRHRERAAIVLLGESRASLEEAEHEKSQEHLENMSTEEWDELEEASKRASNWMSREETSLTFDTKIDVDKKMTFEKGEYFQRQLAKHGSLF